MPPTSQEIATKLYLLQNGCERLISANAVASQNGRSTLEEIEAWHGQVAPPDEPRVGDASFDEWELIGIVLDVARRFVENPSEKNRAQLASVV